eukprot:15151888-Alexandrium_andersonii.AAC.1
MLGIFIGLTTPWTPHLRDVHVFAPTLGPQPQRGSKSRLGALASNTGKSSGVHLNVRDKGGGELRPVP